MKYAVKFRRTCIIAILTLILPLLFSLADADITISNVSPADGAIHIEIENNPPDPAGYVNLSWQLNDSNGGGDMEFYMDVYNGTAWVNRLHLTNQNNGTWYHNEDEAPFNQTNQTCYWRIRAKDQTSGVWTNQTFTFNTDRVPDKPIVVSPSNGSYVEKGDIPLSVVVRHPDYTFGWTSIDLDGSNDDVRVPDDNSLNLTSSFSVDMALWIEDTPADGKFDTIISKMTDASTGWGIALYSENGIWELHICVDGHNQTVGTATLPTHTWVYLTVVFDNDTHTMYVYRNGTLVYSYNEPNTPSANTADLVIGECSYVGNDKTFDGKIDYIRVYNVALTPNEVMANYYGKNDNGAKRGLVSWWKFDENTGTTTADSWGSNDGTLEDGATWATGSQASTTYYGKIHNVTFYEYPSGRIIGWNYSATGWTNGEIVKCNSTYHLEYEGTKYYWYAKSMDDEYWGDASDVYYVETYYNDTEPTKVYYSTGADIYVNPPYTESEPDKVYYSIGSQINVYYKPEFSNLQPENGSEDVWLSTTLSADVEKGGDYTNWDIVFYTNNTYDGSWAEIDRVNDVSLGGKKTAWWNVTIDNSANANPLTNYTAEITITDEDFFNLTSGKENIRVFDTDKTTPLDYYIDMYDSTNKIARIYAKIPSIPANSVKYIYIHTNETCTTDLSDGSKLFTFYDNMETWSGWTQYSDGQVSQSSARKYMGSYSAYKTTNSDPNGAYKSLVSSLGRDIILEFWDNRNSGYSGGASDRVGLFDNSGNGYGWGYTHDASPASIGIDVRDDYTGTISNADASQDIMDAWVFGRLIIKSGGEIDAYVYDNAGNLIGSNTITDTSYSTFTNFYIFGGYDYWIDEVRVRPYISNEPAISVSKESSGQYIIPSTISVWFSGLDWNTTYYWKVGAYNSTMDRWFWSDVYHFTTLQNDSEPSKTYYSQGADIYVQPEYNESEPDIVYYSIGSQVNVYNIADLSNPYPVDGATGVWLSTPLRIDVNKTGDVMQLDIVFEANDTVDGSWHELYKITKSVPPNATIQTMWWSGLEWNTTYYWRVKAINTTTGMAQYSDIYHFTTTPYTDTEPTKAYYSQGADIYVNPIYMASEPNNAYYSVGSQIPVSPPHPEDPIPADNTAYGKTERDFSVYISDIDENDTIDKVEFYIGGSKYGEIANVSANSRATLHVSGLTNYTWYQWYVKVYDGNWIITSDIWRYRPANNPPMIDEDPDNGSTNVAVYRKLVGGEWKHFVRLYWNLTDGDGDGMSFRAWIKDPSTGTWIQRWTILDYSMYNGSYYHDEELFNETGQTYYWKVWASDGKNETTQIFHFYSQFFIDFWWTPEYPTTDDTVHFYSLTEGADDFRWEFGDGTNVTGVNETTHQYLLAGYYNVTLWTYNATNDVWGYLTKTIRIDRNVTLLTPKEGEAGYNWVAWQGNKTNASELSEVLNLSKGYWIHYYNSTSDEWEGYFVGYNAGINSVIDNWDTTVIVVNRNITKRINATEIHNFSTKNGIYMKEGYNVLSWSVYSKKNASQLPLDFGEWAYKYDTIHRRWQAYLKGVGGEDFRIRPYDALLTYLNNSDWWNLMFGD